MSSDLDVARRAMTDPVIKKLAARKATTVTDPRPELFEVPAAAVLRALARRRRVLRQRTEALWYQLRDMDRRHQAERAALSAALDAALGELDDVIERRRKIEAEGDQP